MSRHGRSERALRKDLDRLARAKAQPPAPPDRVIVPFSADAPPPDVAVTSAPAVRPLEHRSGRVGAGVHIVDEDGGAPGVPHAS